MFNLSCFNLFFLILSPASPLKCRILAGPTHSLETVEENNIDELWDPSERHLFNHDFYVVVGKQRRSGNAYTGHQHNIFI